MHFSNEKVPYWQSAYIQDWYETWNMYNSSTRWHLGLDSPKAGHKTTTKSGMAREVIVLFTWNLIWTCVLRSHLISWKSSAENWFFSKTFRFLWFFGTLPKILHSSSKPGFLMKIWSQWHLLEHYQGRCTLANSNKPLININFGLNLERSYENQEKLLFFWGFDINFTLFVYFNFDSVYKIAFLP